MEPQRLAVPRDIRLLLSVVLIPIALLRVLARIRFPERVQIPVAPNPLRVRSGPVRSIWAVPDSADFETGSFVFSADGSLGGLAIEHEGRAVVPGERLIALKSGDERRVREKSVILSAPGTFD